MADSYARITGRVLNFQIREGNNDRGPWSFPQVDVLVGERGVTTVTLDKTLPQPRAGEDVDYLATVSTSKYGPRFNAVADFPVLVDSYGS